MKFLFGALLLLTAPAFGATWYVRTDGAAPTFCDGHTNAPYSATVTNKACAIAHPMYLLPPNLDGNDVGRKALIAGGDIVNIAAGTYGFGLPFNGGSWGSCSTSWPYDCHMQPLPSGTASQPTQILGAGSSSTIFFGQGGAGSVLNLTGSNNVVVQGIQITDHSNCIDKQPDKAVACVAGGLWADNGITDTDGKASNIPSSNVTLNDVVVQGMAKYGVLAGNISGWTVTNSKINANGFGGWSTDLSPAYSVSSGTNTFSNVEIAFNGCAENYPTAAIVGCWGQQTGGYGDGFGSSSSSDKGTWNFSNVQVHDNTQDGLDFLHADPSATIVFDHVNAYRNAGNQLKANGTVTVSNSTVNAYCSAFVGVGDMTGNNSQGGGSSGDQCRAGGDAIVFSMSAARTATMVHDTVLSQGNCVITVADSGVGDATSKLVVRDSAIIGLPAWIQGPQNPPNSCLWYWNLAGAAPSMSNNVVWNTKGWPPAGNLVADPLIANETLIGFDPTPLAGSPLLGKASDGTNIGAVQNQVPPTPPVVACTGGIVSGGACYCPVNTTLILGTCSAIPKACTPTPIMTTVGNTSTCSAVCQ